MKHTIDYNQDGIYDNMKIEKVKVSSQDEYGPRVVEIKTDNCKVDLVKLEEDLDKESVLIIHSLSGYFYKQPMTKIHEI